MTDCLFLDGYCAPPLFIAYWLCLIDLLGVFGAFVALLDYIVPAFDPIGATREY